RAGSRLVLADIDKTVVESRAAELGQVAVAADVTRADDLARLVDEPYRRFGRLDVLFNNAGVIRLQPLLDVTATEWDRVLNVNLRAGFFGTQADPRRRRQQKPNTGAERRRK